MSNEATRTLRAVLTRLRREQVEISGQVSAIEGALQAINGRPAHRAQGMSQAKRQAISRRMKAFWKRKARAKK